MIRTDCIHHHDYSIGNKNICDRYDGYCFVKDSENPVEVCKHFKSKDGTYHNGTEHCPKCGKAVSEWGLCDECRKMYEDMRCINDEERKAWDLLIAKKNHALFQSMLCRQEDNSWESVSK